MTVARLSVEHETLYTYASPVEQAQHIACLRPLSDAGQRLLSFEMAVQPTPTQHSTRRDDHGNSRAYFALHVAHQSLRVVARSEVRVTARYEGLADHLAGRLPGVIGADRIFYQDLEDLKNACREVNPEMEAFDCSVFDGNYVTGDIDEAYLAVLEASRNDAAKDNSAGDHALVDMHNQDDDLDD